MKPTHHSAGRPDGFGRASRLAALLASLVLVTACTAAATPGPRAPGVGEPGEGSSGGFGDEGGPGGGPVPTGAPGAIAGQQIAWTGRLQLLVEDLDQSLAAAQSAVTGLGGFVSASRRSGGDRPVASVTYRIPSERWEEGLAALRDLAVRVVDEQTDSADLASQIVDVDARLRNLRASETALQQIATQATRISDVLEVQARLTEVRGQIESLAAQQAALVDRVALGTLTVTFGTEVVAVTQAAERWDPAREVDQASAALVSTLQGLATAGIWFAIVWLPGLLVALVVLWLGVRVWRRVRPRLPSLPGQPAPTYAWGGAPGWVGSGSAPESRGEPTGPPRPPEPPHAPVPDPRGAEAGQDSPDRPAT